MTDELSQAKGRDSVKRWMTSLDKPYTPRIETPQLGYFDDFCSFVRETWRPVLFGVALGVLIVAAVLLTFQPLGN